MKKILLISHGYLAKGMYETLQLFVPQIDNVTYITAYVGETDPKIELAAFWDSVQENDCVVIVSDILAGSTNQLVYPYIHRKNTYIFTGMNLPMLLQIICSDVINVTDIIENARQGIVFVNDIDYCCNDDDE